jgi:hypothetical protein
VTIKAAYVVGTIYGLCTSVSTLLAVRRDLLAETYLPASGVCASGMEMPGRCILGVVPAPGDAVKSLTAGFKWLYSSTYWSVPDNFVLLMTTTGVYDIETLVHLRHFAAHGQATAKAGSPIHVLPDIEMEITDQMPPLITDGLERWWNGL